MQSLSLDGCLNRQRRFRERLDALNVDAAVLTDNRDIYYLTGVLLPDHLPALLWLNARDDASAWLIAPEDSQPRQFAGLDPDDCQTYAWSNFGTLNPDPMWLMNAALTARVRGMPAVRRLGWQAESMPRLCGETLAQQARPDAWVAVDEVLTQMQRCKDADEVDMLRHAAQVNLAGYTAAQQAIRPGANELAVLAAGQRGAMLRAGELVQHDGDYRCGEYNGPARDRCIEADEIYIIDAQTRCRGYWSDLARSFRVAGQPSALQQSIFDHIAAIQHDVPAMLKPGVEGRDLWRWLDGRIREHPALAGDGLTHHGGHSIGLHLHEMPDINRDRGGVLEAGNVMCVEPGGYTAAARYGARIENTYLVTEAGAVNLSEYPITLNLESDCEL